MKKRKNNLKKDRMPAMLAKDVSNRNILKDPLLCAQFLRNYVDSSLFKDLRPEDIEDESEKYQAYLGIAFETDAVKKICMGRREREKSFYMISLVEHKSQVDYNVSMQILRYMVCIWYEYGKEMMSLGKGDIRNKNFLYPPILPVVYYEGSARWTADFYLKERILMKDFFGSYIPDFTYKLIRNHDYSNEELLRNEDEMSLLMMLGRAQTPADIHQMVEAEKDKVARIVDKAPEHILELIASTVWSLCMKMNVPQEEAEQCVRKVRERQMGYWFENIEKMDIQEERRNTAKAREEALKAQKELAEAVEAMKEREKEIKKEIKKEIEEKEKENTIKSIIHICRKFKAPKEQIVAEVMENCQLDTEAAKAKVDLYLQ